jgi:hypothetical protein
VVLDGVVFVCEALGFDHSRARIEIYDSVFAWLLGREGAFLSAEVATQRGFDLKCGCQQGLPTALSAGFSGNSLTRWIHGFASQSDFPGFSSISFPRVESRTFFEVELAVCNELLPPDSLVNSRSLSPTGVCLSGASELSAFFQGFYASQS